MKKELLVMRYEIRATVRRRSFLLIFLGVPLLMAAISLALWYTSRPQPAPTTRAQPRMTEVEGFVDYSRIIDFLPQDVMAGKLLRFSSEQDARQALANQEVKAYYLVPADYVATGKLTYVHPQANITTSARTAQVMQWVLLYNMLAGDMERARQVWNPMQLTATSVAPAPERRGAPDEGLFMLPYAVVLVFCVVVLMSGSLLRNSLGEERKNRLQEILLTAASPKQILAGKITALGIVGLAQMLFWASAGYILLQALGQSDVLSPGTDIPPALIGWTVIFFLLGYAVYGSLLGGLGALTGPNTPGSSTADVIIVWPMLIPLALWGAIVDNPDGALAVTLSLFPLTSPVAMLMRLVVGAVPAWQLGLALLLLALTAWLVLRGVAATFRAQHLLSGQPFSIRRYVAMIAGRE